MPGFPIPPLLQFLFPPVILTAFADLMRFFRVLCIFVAPLYRNLQAHLQNELNPTQSARSVRLQEEAEQ
jgi:hypothetical protein